MSTYSTLSDQELVTLLKEGNKYSFAEIFTRYHAPLYAHAFNKLRDEDEAYDIVQEIFTRLWSRRADLDADNNLAGYLFRGVRNAIIDLIRHKKIVTTYEQSFAGFVLNNTATADHLIREKQFAAMIEKEIGALPPRMREVFELRRRENLSNKEIALRMNIAESTVADQMKKAIRVLRMRIGLVLVLILLSDSPASIGEEKKNFFLDSISPIFLSES